MTLGAFLKAQLANREAWNCSTLAADWCMSLGYPDFAAQWRGIVDVSACDQTQSDAGGLVRLWRQGIGEMLPIVQDDGAAGDIAVITALGFDVGAIFTGDRWALRGARGMHFLATGQVHVIEAWRP